MAKKQAKHGPAKGEGGRPPALLEAYRWVAGHQHDATEDSTRRLLQDVRTDTPGKFLEQWHQLERAYKGGPLNLGVEVQPGADGGEKVKWDGKGPCPTCGQEPDPYAGKTNAAVDELLAEEFEILKAFDAQRRAASPVVAVGLSSSTMSRMQP